jgi:hypothetical protein
MTAKMYRFHASCDRRKKPHGEGYRNRPGCFKRPDRSFRRVRQFVIQMKGTPIIIPNDLMEYTDSHTIIWHSLLGQSFGPVY